MRYCIEFSQTFGTTFYKRKWQVVYCIIVSQSRFVEVQYVISVSFLELEVGKVID